MLNILRELCFQNVSSDIVEKENEEQNEENVAAVLTQNEKTQLFILPGKEFMPDECKQRLQSIRLPYESKVHDAFDHRVFATSLIPYNNEIMIRAGGALLRFLDRQAIELLHIDLVDGCIPILDINVFSMYKKWNDFLYLPHFADLKSQ